MSSSHLPDDHRPLTDRAREAHDEIAAVSAISHEMLEAGGSVAEAMAGELRRGRSTSSEDLVARRLAPVADVDDGRVMLFDTTLRDGEQSPGISLDVVEKVEIAETLGRLGVDVIEAGFPVSSPGDFEAVQAIADMYRQGGPVIAALSRTALGDVDRAWDAVRAAKRPRLHVFIATSDIHMRAKLRMTPDEVIAAAAEAVDYARGLGAVVEFSPEDASRSEMGFMCEVLQAVVDAGATVLNIPDTVGWAVMGEWARRLEEIRRRVKGDWMLSAHCHDDLGLAVANSLAAIEVGARQVHVTVNGIGERAGNAAIEEVAMALRLRGDELGGERGRVWCGLNTTELARASRLVSRLTGYPVQYNKAVVGRNAFAHESGIHQHGVLADRSTYEIIDAAAVGAVGAQIVLGKHSGRRAFADAAARLGIELSGEALASAFVRFKELADHKGELTDGDIEAICAADLGGVDARRYELVGFRAEGGNAETNFASVELDGDGGVRGTGQGDGLVAAAMAAVTDALVRARYDISGVELVDYRVSSVGSGADALADVVVQAQRGGRKVSGRGLAADVVEASARAWLDALERFERVTATKAPVGP